MKHSLARLRMEQGILLILEKQRGSSLESLITKDPRPLVVEVSEMWEFPKLRGPNIDSN